jgi:ribosomal protein L40E
MICERCKATIADTAKFCPKCGAKVEPKTNAQDIQTKKCPACGAENPLSAKFCKVDGYNFQQAKEKPAVKPAEPQESSGKVLCPQCGAAYDVGIKFCKKDGASLQKDSGVKESPRLKDVKTERSCA